MAKYLASAFSLNMLEDGLINLSVNDCGTYLDELLMNGKVINAIGHADTALLVSNLLAQDGINVEEAKRRDIKLVSGDQVIVAQYKGIRLPEGATSLPKNARIDWKLVEVS